MNFTNLNHPLTFHSRSDSISFDFRIFAHDKAIMRKNNPKGRDRRKPEREKPKTGKKPFLAKPVKGKKLMPGKGKIDDKVRLNKFIANAGICSRREADELIKAGAVEVNGKVVTELGVKVGPNDNVKYGGESLRSEKKVYLLLNKPKDYLTTVDDPQKRKTILNLVGNACKERIVPVGRLDRNTTGVLLITNDGELTKKLTHPKHEIKKIYHVQLNKNLAGSDLTKLTEGIQLNDGFLKASEASYVGASKKDVGIEIHSGKNSVVRRIFEELGYEVMKLDRVYFAGLTKKNLKKGQWRFLTEQEINYLKMLG